MTLDYLVLHPRSEQIAEKLLHNLPHALIIEGSPGVGVATVAKAIARAIGSPEFVILPKKKAGNEFVVDMKEGSVLIDDIRELYLQTRTNQPGKQVYILDTGEKSMTIGAQNAFLKLLEEPRDNVHFIIATHYLGQLLPTITSRSQLLPVLPVTANQTKQLVDDLHIDDQTKKARLAFVGHGKPALIKRLAEDEEQYEARVAIMTDAKMMLGGNAYDKLRIVNKYRDNRGDSLTLLDDMNHQLKTVVRSQPNKKLIREIERHLTTRASINAGGNIRLQLMADVL